MPDDRPASMGAALDAAMSTPDSGSDATPVESAPADSPAAPIASPPAVDAAASPTPTPDGGGSTPGPIPYDRFQAVIRERNDIRDQLAGLSWAQQIRGDVAPRFAEMVQRYQGDPVAFASELIAEIQAHPEHSARLRSEAARVLRGRGTGADQATAPPEPDIKIPNGDGTVTVWRSAENQKAWDAHREQQLLAKIEERLAPLQAIQQERAELARGKEAIAQAKASLAEIRHRPHFQEHKGAITERFKALMQGQPDDPMVARLMLNTAYLDVLQSDVFPTLSGHAKAEVLQSLKSQATAGTLNPAAPTPTPVTRPRSLAEALKREFAKG